MRCAWEGEGVSGFVGGGCVFSAMWAGRGGVCGGRGG